MEGRKIATSIPRFSHLSDTFKVKVVYAEVDDIVPLIVIWKLPTYDKEVV